MFPAPMKPIFLFCIAIKSFAVKGSFKEDISEMFEDIPACFPFKMIPYFHFIIKALCSNK